MQNGIRGCDVADFGCRWEAETSRSLLRHGAKGEAESAAG